MISLRGVGHVYGAGTPWAHRALRDVDLHIARGERVLVVGDNGSGKTTLAWILAGLIEPAEGSATVDGTPAHRARGAVVIGFQEARLQLFRPTVRQDVAYGTRLNGDGVDEALRLVGLDPQRVRDRKVDELSGGQERRVALAGLIVRRPKALVLDEPLAGLDTPTRASMSRLIGSLAERNMATVVVSHDLEDGAALADRVVRLDGGAISSDGPAGWRTPAGTDPGGRT